MSDTIGTTEEVAGMLDAIPDATFLVQDGHHVHCNAAALRLFHLSSTDELGRRPFHEYVHPEEQDEAITRNERILAGDTVASFVERSFDSTTGTWRHLELTGAPTTYDGRPAVMYVVRDVTNRVREVERTRSISERLVEIVDSFRVGAGLTDAGDVVRTANRALRTLVGGDPVGRGIDDLVDRGRRTEDDGGAGIVAQLVCGPNAGRWVRLTWTAVAGDEGAASLVQVEDVDAEVRREELLERQSSHDQVTDLLNRIGFLEELSEASVHGPASVVVLDLDDFALVNESHGLAVGDEVLRAVGARLRAVVRPGDTIARLGGDSFAVLAPALDDTEQAVAIARRCHAAIGERLVVDDATLHLRASVGVAVGRRHDPPDQVLRAADAALAAARRAGGERVELARGDAAERARERLDLDAALRQALRDGDIEAHLQPVWRIAHGECIAFEALARWTRPDGERVRPDRFVALAEELNLSRELDLHVARRAAEALAADVRRGHSPASTYLAVNVDPFLLSDPGAARDLMDAVAAEGIPAERLVVEVTERRITDDGDAMLEAVGLLQSHGVRFALDDFGVGQSSLARLITLPFDIIKLDRRFVHHITQARGCDVLAGIIEMSNRVQLRHVVEGVETEPERLALQALGAETAQGWLVAPALAPEELAGFDMRRGRFTDPTAG